MCNCMFHPVNLFIVEYQALLHGRLIYIGLAVWAPYLYDHGCPELAPQYLALSDLGEREHALHLLLVS